MRVYEGHHPAFRFIVQFTSTRSTLHFMPAFFLLALFSGISIGVTPAAAADCASLTGLQLKDTTITFAVVVPAAGLISEYCKVLGNIHNLPQSTIQFEVSMPISKW